MSTRVIGAMIMSHIDDKGLILPPKVAPIQAVIVPIIKSADDRDKINVVTQSIVNENSNIRIQIDKRDFLTVGEKFYEWEKKGVPLRIEIGPRDLTNKHVVIVRRDTGEKEFVVIDMLSSIINERLEEIQESLFTKSEKRTLDNIFEVETWAEFKDIIENQKGFVHAYYDGTPETESKIKDETKATTRCRLLDKEYPVGKCVYTGKETTYKYIFAKAY
jgi:prolyl-tRNA synthetase